LGKAFEEFPPKVMTTLADLRQHVKHAKLTFIK